MKNKNKVELYAPQEYWQLHPNDKKKICNECGPNSTFGDYVPNHILWVNISECCNIHNYMYSQGKTENDRHKADRIFRNNMFRIIKAKTKYKWLRKLRMWIAKKYYHAVSEYGAAYFWKGKNSSINIKEI